MTESPSEFRLERLGPRSGDPPILLKFGSSTIGRTPANIIVCNSRYVSRKHCEISVTETGQVTVKNAATLNGIFINGTQKLEQDTEICLNVNDVLGIGCDTSCDEIQDDNCFIYQLKGIEKEMETIVLDDSDEEEYKIQEEYSQMNQSEMKLEMMELEEFVEEYSRIKNEPLETGVDDDVEFIPEYHDAPIEEVTKDTAIENAEDVELKDVPVEEVELKDVPVEDDVSVEDSVPAEYVPVVEVPVEDVVMQDIPAQDTQVNRQDEKHDYEDVFDNIIFNSNKSCAEKTDLIKGMVPDVAFLLEKDCTSRPDPSNGEILHEDISSEVDVEKKVSKESKKCTTAGNAQHIKKRRVTVSLTSLKNITNSKSISVHKKASSPELVLNTANNSISPPQQRINSVNTSLPPQRVSFNTNTLMGNVPSKIMKRRQTCFIPSSNIPSIKCATKRQIPIIDAPHIQKRRKSIGSMPENFKRQTKPIELDNKWLSKNVKHERKKRSKEEKDELKSKLSALVPKEKVAEPKIARPNLKIPVKNTHKTRNDFLTDTMVKTMTSATSKVKITNTSHHSEIDKRLRMPSKNEINNVKSNGVRFDICADSSTTHRIVEKEEIKVTEPKVNVISKSVQNSSNDITNFYSNKVPSPNRNAGNFTTSLPSTSTATVVVKSILKNPNKIQKRRATVTFADESRIKNVTTIPTVKTGEDDCDDVISNLMLLGVASLEKTNCAQINGNNFSYKAVTHEYETLKDLQDVFVPLMKAELWKEIEDGYSKSKNAPPTHVQMNYYVTDEHHKNRFRYHCETQSPQTIQVGALIIVSNIRSSKDFFAYIVNKQITNKTCYFQFVTPVSGHGSTCTPLTIKPILYIRPNLKVFESLFKLSSSPLLKHILHPKYNCVQLKNQPFEYKGYSSLNLEQMTTLSKVYQRCISGKPFITLIEGPPGTGKSRLITNLIVQLLYGNEVKEPLKILFCAPSNAAVDVITRNLLEARKNYLIKENQKKIRIVRFGVLEKMDRSVQGASLQELTRNNERRLMIERGKLSECKKKKELELENWMNSKVMKERKEKIDAIRREITLIDTKMRFTYDDKCLLENAHVICTTLNSCCTLSNKISSMDICIIDEATQCNEPTSLIPLQFGVKSLILIGDTKQLPSTVLSEIAKQYNYDQSLFQRLQKSFEAGNENPILQLTSQYRMHPDILHWPNQYFYKNRLVSTPDTLKNYKLKLKPYTVFNLNFEQSSYSGEKHISNVDEANFVRHLLDFLITKADSKLYSYGIISAYSQQKDDLAKNLGQSHPYVTVNTIDSYQGQERDIIIISIARTRGIGFLAIRQRLNVALTRAKKMLILCGNFNALQNHPMWTSLLDDAKQRKFYVHLPKMKTNELQPFFEKSLVLC